MGMFSRFTSRMAKTRNKGLRHLVMPTGHDDPKVDELKEAAAHEAAEIIEDRDQLRGDAPGLHL